MTKAKFHGKVRQEIATILALLTYQHGQAAAISDIMEEFGVEVTPAAARAFASLDKEKAYCMQYKHAKKVKHYTDRLANAKSNSSSEKEPGYSAGCLGMTDTVTSDIAMVPNSSFPEPNVGDYVAVAFAEHGMCIGKVTAYDNDQDDTEFEAIYMTQLATAASVSEYVWSKPGDAKYEGPVYTNKNTIMAILSDPAMSAGSTARRNNIFYFSSEQMSNASKTYESWKSREARRKNRKRKM